MIKLKVGDKAPQFSVKDQDGNIINLKDFKGKKGCSIFLSKSKYSWLYCREGF